MFLAVLVWGGDSVSLNWEGEEGILLQMPKALAVFFLPNFRKFSQVDVFHLLFALRAMVVLFVFNITNFC